MIPKIIHQTWKNEDVPSYFRSLTESWKKLHPEWQYILWTDEMNLNFIKSYFPDFLRQYLNYEFPIQRVDGVRYFILYQFGGIFVDLDFECFRNLQPLLSNSDCVFGKESDEQAILHHKKIIVSNAFMASIPKAEFMKIICDELYKPVIRANNNTIVLESTGPFMITDLYLRCGSNFPRLKVLESSLLYPLSQSEVRHFLGNDQNDESIKLKLQKAYALHYYWGSWWKHGELDLLKLKK